MKSSDKPKLIAAVVIFAIAAVLIAWNFGIFGGGGGSTQTPPIDPNSTVGGGPRTAPGTK